MAGAVGRVLRGGPPRRPRDYAGVLPRDRGRRGRRARRSSGGCLMVLPHVFVETSFLFGAFRLASKRNAAALALRGRFEAGEVKLYVPYLCFQAARDFIGRNLPS